MIIAKKKLEKENKKRAACWDPAQQWQAIQETINWAEAQLPVPRNSCAACLQRQKKAARRVY